MTNQRNLKEPFVKIAMGFEVGGWDDERVVTAVVLNQLLGVGEAFLRGARQRHVYWPLPRGPQSYSFAESTEGFVSLNEDWGSLVLIRLVLLNTFHI